MRGRYYVMNGMMASCSGDEKRIDALLPKNFQGNAVEKLTRQGYILDESKGALFSPDGAKVADFTQVV